MDTYYDILRERRGEYRAFAQVIRDAVDLLEIVDIYSDLESIAQRDGNLDAVSKRAEMQLPMLGERIPKPEDVIAGLKQYEAKGERYAVALEVLQGLEKALNNMKKLAERRVA